MMEWLDADYAAGGHRVRSLWVLRFCGNGITEVRLDET